MQSQSMWSSLRITSVYALRYYNWAMWGFFHAFFVCGKVKFLSIVRPVVCGHSSFGVAPLILRWKWVYKNIMETNILHWFRILEDAKLKMCTTKQWSFCIQANMLTLLNSFVLANAFLPNNQPNLFLRVEAR